MTDSHVYPTNIHWILVRLICKKIEGGYANVYCQEYKRILDYAQFWSLLQTYCRLRTNATLALN